jgi:uncharacterized protein
MSDAPPPNAERAEAEAPRQDPAPTAADERIDALDVLRGFALFGVLVVNMAFWFRTSPYRYELSRFPFPALVDRIADALLAIAFEVRFLSLFSFLFGVGLSIQLERATRSRARPFRLLARRMGVLLGLGVAHILLLWSGDILHVYALLGLLLLPLLRRKPKTLGIVVACMLALPVLGTAIAFIVRLARGVSALRARDTAEFADVQAKLEENVRAFGQGGWLEVAGARLTEYLRFAPGLGVAVLQAFVMALLGIIAWKKGILQRPSEHRALLRRIGIGGLIFGIGFSSTRLAAQGLVLPEVPLWIGRSFQGIFPAAMAASALAYGALILLALEREGPRVILAHLAPVGRMALSSYLLQSVICSFIFFGFGLGLYDKVGTAAGVLIAVAIFAAQIAASRLWFQRFQFGPVEWLWRSLTYGRAQPMRRPAKK